MAGRSKLIFSALVLVIWLCSSPATAQQNPSTKQTSATRARHVLLTGLRTDRLTPKENQYWERMKRIVFATDFNGRFWHQTLVDLWTQLDNSGHTIYVELQTESRRPGTIGGIFRIQHFDPRGRHHVALIRLYLNSIEHAHVGPLAARSNGFIPFEYMSREERYVEVLGHELAHAVWILSDLKRSARVADMIEQTNEMFLSRQGQVENDPEMIQRLYHRDILIEELEAQAEAVEVIVWRELLCSKVERTRAQKFKQGTREVSNYAVQLAAGNPPPR